MSNKKFTIERFSGLLANKVCKLGRHKELGRHKVGPSLQLIA